jgi:hypothetical protein
MNKYNRIYEQLIKKARDRDFRSKKYRLGTVEPTGIVEVHHILPRSLGGTNVKSNLVVFTPKEHFIAHLLLTKIYKGNYKIIKAFVMMCRQNPSKRAEDYQIIRQTISHVYSEQAQTFYKREDAKKIISDSSKEFWTRPEYREKQMILLKERNTPEFLKKLSKAQKKANENPEIKQKRIKAIKNHMHTKSPEWVEKMRIINKNRMNTIEWKEWSSNKYKTSNFNNSRKVLDKLDGTVYNSAQEAANARGLKYEVVKKWLYKGIPKHNLVWLDEQEIEDGEVRDNHKSVSGSSEGTESDG